MGSRIARGAAIAGVFLLGAVSVTVMMLAGLVLMVLTP
jgi:hypothetical protein